MQAKPNAGIRQHAELITRLFWAAVRTRMNDLCAAAPLGSLAVSCTESAFSATLDPKRHGGSKIAATVNGMQANE